MSWLRHCKTCGITCSSDYSYKQHLEGRKHKENIAGKKSTSYTGGGGGQGVCFYYQEGRCWKGSACTYRHVKPELPSTSSMSSSRIISTPGVCFKYLKGTCTRGAACPYKHGNDDGGSTSRNMATIAAASAPVLCRDVKEEAASSSKRPADNSNVGTGRNPPAAAIGAKSSKEVTAEFLLCKVPAGSTTDKNSNAAKNETPDKADKGNALSMLMSASKSKAKAAAAAKVKAEASAKAAAAAASKFPSSYRDALKRKRDVNLYIQNGVVVWQFAYNTLVMNAIKTHIKGRKWDPAVGVKGSWTCPLESLPDCIALYEYMGRTPDAGLKKRAREIAEAYGGGSASDVIKIVVRFSVDDASKEVSSYKRDGDNDYHHISFGSATFTFFYDANVVEALKMLPPSSRNYDPSTKKWTVDLAALPHALEYLEPLGYSPSKELKAVTDSVTGIDDIIHSGGETVEGKPDDAIPDLTLAKSESSSSPVAGLKQEENAAPSSADVKQEESLLTPADVKPEDSALSSQLSPEEIAFEEALVASAEKAEDLANQLKTKFKDLIGILQKVSKKGTTKKIDRSNYGHAKRRRLTSSQIAYSRRLNGEDDYGDYDEYMYDSGKYYDDYGNYRYDSDDSGSEDPHILMKSVMDAFSFVGTSDYYSRREQSASDCDCGRPSYRVGGRHTCRYFGKFRCSCGNAWTSAYCWRGEAQSCRSCNRESLPVRKEKLDGRKGKGTGAHDSARCAMCRKLGYNCSAF